ncbi:hypothetical protein [Alicyclobacillus vulcanalis]|nr:hypothetical protein [Alicyclobacillus vulcanalis]
MGIVCVHLGVARDCNVCWHVEKVGEDITLIFLNMEHARVRAIFFVI